MHKIIIIEDDSEIAELERDYFEAAGLSVDIVTDGISGRNLALSGDYSLVILDLMLPGLDGFNVCREIRQRLNIPIIIVSARQTDIDKIRSFGLGADDYMIKPFSPSELTARVKRHLFRYDELLTCAKSQVTDQLTCRDLLLDKSTRRVFLKQQEIPLRNKEFELLCYLMENAGIVFSAEKLFDQIWGMESFGDTSTVAVHINRLRKKIEIDLTNPFYIETVRGAGYRFHDNKLDI